MSNLPNLDGANWFKSTYSSSSQGCVEVALDEEHYVGVRDSKDPQGGHLVVNRRTWAEFLDTIR